MNGVIRTNKSWQRHMPQRPRRNRRSYYSEPKSSSKKIIIYIIYIIITILLIQSIFQINYFKIDTVELNGQNDLSVDELQEFLDNKLSTKKFLFFENNNYFLVPVDSLQEQLKQEYNLEDAVIEKSWPDSLKITVKEKSSHFIWQKDDSLYLLDAQGLLNRQISVLDHKYLVLDDKRDHRPSGDKIFTDEEIDIINQIYLNWMDLVASKAKLTKITIYNNWDLDLNTEIGFYVKIDKDQDIKEQLTNLRRVLEENITGVDIDYIDVRFGDKVYFK